MKRRQMITLNKHSLKKNPIRIAFNYVMVRYIYTTIMETEFTRVAMSGALLIFNTQVTQS